MAKQFIISAMEEVFGEYILNMSKENLKIAALRGKIKLENVQLDGDLIGGHVLGAVGLSGFGILSCSAKSLKVSVPWNNLEKEPTRFEVSGVHLVCVPLMPSTAHQMYGAGTLVDPRCTLRTRAKRLILARFERNYWNGMIPDEGPPMKRVQRAVREVERDLRKNSRNRRRMKDNNSEEDDIEAALDNLVYNLSDTESTNFSDTEEKSSKDSFAEDNLPELPRDWKVKLREKVLRNMEATLNDIHIRVEVSERALDLQSGPTEGTEGSRYQEKSAEERAFALGFTLDSLVVRTANEKWEVGSHDKRNPVDGSAMSSVQGHLGPNEYVVKNNKIGYFSNISMYWDDEPPILLAETDVLRGNYRKLSPEKLQSRIAAAMDAMFYKQEPGKDVRKSLSVPVPSDMDVKKPHQYVVDSFAAEVRARQSDRPQPGPISCSADVLPFVLTCKIRPHQYFQYHKLKAAMKSQQRFDTMLRQRPKQSAMENPRAWWKYAVACVTARPNSRPWDDVKRIVNGRGRYIELIIKKNSTSSERNGYHAGLSESESAELLALEDLLPVEAMLAFHLVALRRVYESQKDADSVEGYKSPKVSPDRSKSKNLSKSMSRFRLRGSSSSKKRPHSSYQELEDEPMLPPGPGLPRPPNYRREDSWAEFSNAPGEEDSGGKTISLLDAMNMRLGKKKWFIHWKLHDATVNVLLYSRRDDTPLAHLAVRGCGSIRSFGKGKRDLAFDITQFDIFHRESRVLYVSAAEHDPFAEDAESQPRTGWERSDSLLSDLSVGLGTLDASPDLLTPSGFLELPPPGVVCSLVAGINLEAEKLSISAHPATFLHSPQLIDGLSEYLPAGSTDHESDLADYIRNAATPLARKAQLALFSPISMGMHLNIAAPKIWVPVSSEGAEGALFLDAGTLKVGGIKGEGETDMNWDIQARDIQVNFAKRLSVSWLENSELRLLSHLSDPAGRGDTSIIYPFNITAEARNRVMEQDVLQPIGGGSQSSVGPVRSIKTVVSPVCVNLVDAEVLARAFGKLYSRGLHSVRRRVSLTRRDSKSESNLNERPSRSEKQAKGTEDYLVRQSSVPRFISLTVEKVEMAIEGHSKRAQFMPDERSHASMDSFHESSPPIRTYLVELSQIEARRSLHKPLTRTAFSVMDASIIRLRDGSQYSPQKNIQEATDAQYCILVRSSPPPSNSPAPDGREEHKIEPIGGKAKRDHAPVIKASLFHDGVIHLDEVEVDIDSVILRVTPTSLKDCAKAFKRIAELAQLMTKEMERKVHEEGRKARQMDRSVRDGDGSQIGQSNTGSSDRADSPITSEALTDTSITDRRTPNAAADSSILIRITMRESTLLAGRPTAAIQKAEANQSQGTPFAVIQILSNALVMFQSVENPDATGSKTLHISIENLSSLVNTEFERVPPSQAPPMIGPTGAEFRIVYGTENFGCVVSQDISLDCEAVKSCLTPNDLLIMVNIGRKMFERLRAFGVQGGDSYSRPAASGIGRIRPLSTLIRYQKKGTGIATTIRAQVHAFSFVLLRAYRSYFGAPELLDFNLNDVKSRVEGCMSALSGDCSATLSVNFFNSEVDDWEYVVEPFPLTIGIDQMPNELVLHLSPRHMIQFNLTSILLKALADMKFDLLRDRTAADSKDSAVLTPSALSTVGLRRATEARSIKVQNLTGFDIHIVPDSSPFGVETGLVQNGATSTLDTIVDELGQNEANDFSLSLRVATSAVEEIGDREPVFDLPIVNSSDQSARLHLLRPVALQPGHRELLRLYEGSLSSDSVYSESSGFISAYYNADPVVEWCMHNQRLRSSVVDVFSLRKGRDLLSSSAWSPEDEVNEDIFFSGFQGHEALVDQDGPERAAGIIVREASDSERVTKTTPTRGAHRNNWLRPYLKNDSPEWTDMTCTLRMARERVMLPDDNWMWVNDWTVDLRGKLGESTDADGWEYEADFETFARNRRYYKRGDSCRRRRWTRTRMVRPPRLDDPNRLLKFVWETSKDEHGNFDVVVRSHVRIKNATTSSMTFSVFSPSWDEDKLVGTAQPDAWLNVPVTLASAVYLRLAKSSGSQEVLSIRDCEFSDKVMILPTSHTASNFVRTSLDLKDVSGTTLYFLIEVNSEKGVVDIIVHPVLRIVNLLPCQLECQVGEVTSAADTRFVDSRRIVGASKKKIANVETMRIGSGKEGAFTAANPYRKPHISLRVPGYKWSAWYRVVNRKANSETFRPFEDEEDWVFNSKGDSDFADEFKTIMRFERAGKRGDPLILILGVECGHSPTLRIYSQYWVIDKTGFGCRFAEGFVDILGSIPDKETSRRSHLPPEEAKAPEIKSDMALPGHQWSIGMSGMSLYFSKREKITLAIETGAGDATSSRTRKVVRTKWVSPLDISNVVPKTVFSVDELFGPRRFELAISVTVCPGIFARTKLITLLPRYQIVNLLHRELVVAQDGCLNAEIRIPSQSAVPFHWEKGSLAPKVRLGAPSGEEIDRSVFDKCWTNGRFRLDRVGITSLRLPTDSNLAKTPMVVQAEVRLATKDQSSAVVVVIWSANEKSNPLYLIRNRTPHTILCRQPLQEESEAEGTGPRSLVDGCIGAEGTRYLVDGCTDTRTSSDSGFECGAEIGPMIRAFLGFDRIEEFVWVLESGHLKCFGFDDPEKPHILEWTCVTNGDPHFEESCKKAFLEVDAMGSTSILSLLGGRKIRCQIGAEHSTKVIEFTEVGSGYQSTSSFQADGKALAALRKRGLQYQQMLKSDGVDLVPVSHLELVEEDENVAFGLRLDMPGLAISVIDNANPGVHGREILFGQLDKISFSFSQTREGYHEFEMRIMSFQADNHVHKSIHPVLIFCPRLDEKEPLLHMSAVRRIQLLSNTFIFRYAAIRLLDVEIFLDRRTAETVAHFIEPLTTHKEEESDHSSDWVSKLTSSMGQKFAKPDRRAPRDIEKMIHTANTGRIYFEQLHLHPVRLGLTFTQEWMEWDPGAESMMIFQFIRGMASIANAPLTFTSFVVAHVFEAPHALLRVIGVHYSSQLTKQIFGLLGSLAILGAPADFITNVGTGVRDFFYEPINGAVHGPRQFIEGLEAGTQSLARGVFVGVVRGAANVAEVVNGNLAGLTADDEFIDERKAHQRMMTDAMSRGTTNRSFGDSLYLAGASVARGVKSGALGIVEQPAIYASKHGPVGFLKGVGKALVGAVVKPVVGLGDAAVLVMNHMSDATSKKQVLPKIPKRLRRALPSRSPDKPNCIRLKPYDEHAAKAQKIVTGGESVDDVYLGHINIPSHLVIASDQCLWAIDRMSREPWCISWEEISHFSMTEGGVRVVVFSQTGLKTYIFHVDNASEAQELYVLLSMQLEKMGNSSELNSSLLSAEPESLSRHQIPGIKARQVNHVFGSCNNTRPRLSTSVKDECDLVEQCFARVNGLSSDSPIYCKTLDQEAWSLVCWWGQVFSGLSSRRCIVAGILNGTGSAIQIKSSKLVEGGSPCYTIPTKEYDTEQGILHAGGCILFFGWGVIPSLLQAGNVFMHIETNGFISDLSDQKSRATFAEAMPGYQVGFLEKSYDDAGWWAKYWLLVREKK